MEILNQYNFSKHISYPFIPVICFEASNRAYLDNPYLKKHGATSGQNFISILDGGYEAWGDWSMRFMIKTPEHADEIIKECKIFLTSNMRRISKLVEHDYATLSEIEVAEVLKELDKYLTDLYQLYIFFIDECFAVDNAELNEKLPDLRMELSNCAAKLYEGCDKVVAALATLNPEIPWQAFTFATVGEIREFISRPNKNIEKFKMILNRPLAIVCVDNEVMVLLGQEATTLKKYLNNKYNEIISKEKLEIVSNIKGQAVYKGKAVGRVLKILETDYGNAASIVGEQTDYILVTKMTRPEIVSLIRRAAAIVTDEGGITCHAAIVSRELKKPCIVGTRKATQVLNNGDLVEVDAETGVVTIIERK